MIGAVPVSLRTTKTMWLLSPAIGLASSRTRWAMYTPETALDGTVHEADTAQLPQSISPVEDWVIHAGWLWGRVTDGRIPAWTIRAPLPP